MTELFDRFEVNRMPRWPLMSRLLALSVVVHGLFIVAVVYVPALRSLLYVAGAVSGLQFVSEDYDRTLIGQRATIVQLGPHDKLFYPPDYFGAPQVAETSAFDPMMVRQAAPPPPMPSYRPRRVRTPRAVVAATPQPSPSPEVAQASPSPSPAASPTPDEARKKAEEAELDRIAKENGIGRPMNVNTLPFEDLARTGKAMVDKGELNLNSVISLTATVERNTDGTFNRDTIRLDGAASDAKIDELARTLIGALGESKVFAVLTDVHNMQLKLDLDERNVNVKILAEATSPDVAAKMALGYQILAAKAKNARKGTPEGDLYERLKFDSDGKQFIVSFEMPKEAAGKMIADILAKKAAAAQNKS